jgi:hypothetical protein
MGVHYLPISNAGDIHRRTVFIALHTKFFRRDAIDLIISNNNTVYWKSSRGLILKADYLGGTIDISFGRLMKRVT